MRVMVLVKATEDSEKSFLPTAWTTEMMEAMGRFNDGVIHHVLSSNRASNGGLRIR